MTTPVRLGYLRLDPEAMCISTESMGSIPRTLTRREIEGI